MNDQSNANYGVGNWIIYNTEVLRSNLCDYNNAYILVKGDIVTAAHNAPTKVKFKKLRTIQMYHKNRSNKNRWCWKFRFSQVNV